MSILNLEHSNRLELAEALEGNAWVVACLCAAWCDVCTQYQPGFQKLALQFPDIRFLWIDIEDHADIVEDFDVENFPTLLIQQNDTVAFFGTVQPDLHQAKRLLTAQMAKTATELKAEAASNPERMRWQRDFNLRARLKAALNN